MPPTVTPNLGLHIRGPVATENAANGGAASQWDFDVNMALIDAAFGSGGAVASVFGRTGAVVAVSGDYSVGQVTGAAPLASPALTGTPTAPTPLTADSSTAISTTAFVKAQGYVTAATAPVTSVLGRTGAVVAVSGDYSVGQVTGAAPLASPAFTGTPTAPTPSTADSSTKIATTGYVQAQGYVTATTAPVTTVFGRAGAVVAANNDYSVGQVSGAAPLASPTFTGVPAAPTPATADSSTTIATTAYVQAQGYVTSATAPVRSVFGRTGVVAAAANDYTTTQINGMPASNGAVGQFLQSDGTKYFNNSLVAGLPLVNPKFVSAIVTFTAPGTGAHTLYTVPANKRALVLGMTVFNVSGQTSNFTPQVNVNSTDYTIGAAPSTAVGVANNLPPTSCPILEAGEILKINNNSNTSFNVVVDVVEFDNTSNVKSVRIFSDGTTTAPNSGKIVSGDAIMYQVPSGKSAFLLSTGPVTAITPATCFGYNNASGANRTLHFNIFGNGGTAGSTNQISGATTGTSAAATPTGVSMTLGSLDTVSINCNSNVAGQMAFVNVIEV